MRWTALISGALLAAAYARLHEAVVFRSEMGKSFLLINPRESLFWLSHYLLLVPGLLLMGWALSPWIQRWILPRLTSLARGRDDAPASAPADEQGSTLRKILFAIGLGTLLFLSAAVGRTLFLLDLPITNDEYTILFGAQILLQGSVTAPDIDPAYGFSMPWVFRQDGRISSMDFPGTILLTAFGLLTGLEELLFFFLAASSGVALVFACGRIGGRRSLAWAAIFWLISPMVTTLSMTLHSHLVSRSFVALAFALYLIAVERGGDDRSTDRRWMPWLGAGIGLCAAAGFVSRPAEVATVLAPMALDLLWRARKKHHGTRALAAAAALTSMAGPALMGWWNLQTTGQWTVSARVLLNSSLDDPLWPAVWERLGENLGFNLMMLNLWFLGPLGVILALLALGSGSRLAKVCGAAVACQLLMALLHDSTGIRIVGPIHYSEAAVPLLILAVLGMDRACRLLKQLEKTELAPLKSTPIALMTAYLLSLATWTGVHTGSLIDQAVIHRTPLAAVADLKQAIVIADRPPALWFSRQKIQDVSSWLADLPHPDPGLQNEVLFAYPEADIELLRRDFPDRRLYRMTYHPEGELVRVRPLP